MHSCNFDGDILIQVNFTTEYVDHEAKSYYCLILSSVAI